MTDKLIEADAVIGNLDNPAIFLDAISKTGDISQLGDFIPSADEIRETRQTGDFFSNLEQQTQIALIAFKAGVSVSTELIEGGFDTHDDHDAQHKVLFANLVASLNYLWTYAINTTMLERDDDTIVKLANVHKA